MIINTIKNPLYYEGSTMPYYKVEYLFNDEDRKMFIPSEFTFDYDTYKFDLNDKFTAFGVAENKVIIIMVNHDKMVTSFQFTVDNSNRAIIDDVRISKQTDISASIRKVDT